MSDSLQILLDVILPLKRKGILDRDVYGTKLPWEVFTDDDPSWEYENKGKYLKKTVYTITKLTPKGPNNYVRAAGCGTWYRKSLTQLVKNSRGEVVGQRRQFRFRVGKDENKGRWIMHEFTSNLVKSDKVALCKITVDGFQEPKGILLNDVGGGSSGCGGSRKRKVIPGSDCVKKRECTTVKEENLKQEADVNDVQQLIDDKDCVKKRARATENQENLKKQADVNDVLQLLDHGLSVIDPFPDWELSNNGSLIGGPIPDWVLSL